MFVGSGLAQGSLAPAGKALSSLGKPSFLQIEAGLVISESPTLQLLEGRESELELPAGVVCKQGLAFKSTPVTMLHSWQGSVSADQSQEEAGVPCQAVFA